MFQCPLPGGNSDRMVTHLLEQTSQAAASASFVVDHENMGVGEVDVF
jgi:hypothetical protein